MAPTYQDFYLTLNGSPGAYTVEARGPDDISVPPMPFRLEPSGAELDELEQIIAGAAPSRQTMQAVGERLFEALFPRPVARAYGRAYHELPEGTSLRLKLSIRPPELNVLPWELLYDVDERTFLAARLTSPIVRSIESSVPAASLRFKQPLEILYVQASPRDLAPLDLESSERALREAVGSQARLNVLREASPAGLREQLRQPSHILHFDGHATFDPAAGQGSLFLQDSLGRSQRVSGEVLSAYLDGTSIRLVALVACETGTDSGSIRFSGLAHHLMRSSSLAAAVAMQFPIPNTSAVAFIGGFYGALSDGYPVDAAVVEGRKAILDVLQGDPFAAPDWATPVLFLRSAQENVPPDSSALEQEQSRQPARVQHTSIRTGNITSTGGGVVNLAGGNIQQVQSSGGADALPAAAGRSRLIALLGELRSQLAASELEPEIRAEVEDHLKTVEAQASRETPNKAILAGRLKSAADLISGSPSAGAFAAQIDHLLQVVEQL